MVNKAMRKKLTNPLKGKERKKEQICQVKYKQRENLYTLNFISKGKRRVRKTNKIIYVKKIGLKIKLKKEKRIKRQTPQNCKSLAYMQSL